MPSPPRTPSDHLTERAADSENYTVHGRQFYLHAPHGYQDTNLSNTALEKILNVRATTRNWNTIIHLQNILRDMDSALI